MEDPWLPTVLSILADIPSQGPITKDPIMDMLVVWVLKGFNHCI